MRSQPWLLRRLLVGQLQPVHHSEVRGMGAVCRLASVLQQIPNDIRPWQDNAEGRHVTAAVERRESNSVPIIYTYSVSQKSLRVGINNKTLAMVYQPLSELIDFPGVRVGETEPTHDHDATTTSLAAGTPVPPPHPLADQVPRSRSTTLNNILLLFTHGIITSPTLLTKGNYIDSWYSQPSPAMIHISLKAKWLETH